MSNYTCRRFHPSDREKIYDLYDVVHGKAKADRYRKVWEWEYEHNPFFSDGSRPHVWVAVCNETDRIVGLYCSIPVMLYHAGEQRKALWSVDVMTHPDFRGQGVFNALKKHLLETAYAEGLEIFVALPNHNSGPIFRKTGWFDIRTFPVMIKPLKLWPFLKLVRLKSLPKLLVGGRVFTARFLRSFLAGHPPAQTPSLSLHTVDSFDERADSFFDAVAVEFDFIAVRDAKFLNWRYAQRPENKYTLFQVDDGEDMAGLIILASGRQQVPCGYVVDCMARPGPHQREVLSLLLQAAVKHFRSQRVASIEVCSLDGVYQEVFEKFGFAAVPRGAFWGYDLIGKAEDGDPWLDALRNPDSRWHLARGDADSDISCDC